MSNSIHAPRLPSRHFSNARGLALGVILLLPGAGTIQPAPFERLPGILRGIESRGEVGRIAVVLSHPESGRILFLYNEDTVLRRALPPGSLMKPLVASLLLKRPGFDPGRRLICRGRLRLDPDQISRDDLRILPVQKKGREAYYPCSRRDGHGTVDLRRALVHSCNVYFLSTSAEHPGLYTALRTGWRLDRTTGALGLGYERASQMTPSDRLSPLARRGALIGEGGALRLTPIKIAQIYGSLMTASDPRIPRRDARGTGPVQFRSPARPFLLNKIAGMLAGVVNTDGTLRGLRFPGQHGRILAAKTGTASQYRRKFANHGWNVIYGERHGSPFLLVVFVSKGSSGKQARFVSERIMKEL